MRTATALIGAAGLLAYGAWQLSRQSQSQAPAAQNTPTWTDQASGVLASAGQTTAELIDRATGGILQLSDMAKVTEADLGNPNVQAMLHVIRSGEGTLGPNGYRMLFGGGLFTSFADHPRIAVQRKTSTGGVITSTAAGAYQALASTWDETAQIMHLPDFSPHSQDLFAVGRIAARGALADVEAGRFDVAITKIAREWASMPGSPYGQPVISWNQARAEYQQAGGVMTA